jgi:hypothetical protein
MLADPLVVNSLWSTVTVNAAGNASLPCIERAPNHSLYRTVDADGTVHDIFIGHQFGRRNRYTVRYNVSGLTPDLILDGNNSRYSQSVYVVVDVPPTGPVGNSNFVAPSDLITYMTKVIGGFMVETEAQLPNVLDRVIKGET